MCKEALKMTTLLCRLGSGHRHDSNTRVQLPEANFFQHRCMLDYPGLEYSELAIMHKKERVN